MEALANMQLIPVSSIGLLENVANQRLQTGNTIKQNKTL